ncbi:PREDICTED: probable splicing factor 3A subunit 1 [Camelina sativa]|uniref:Probable splicing factor 3A subunit 1 n=1 Tax=Camelina sativa TaxID=90675 RepID=A0ABM0Z6E9_CAMSA|nr:PREDICTED: probable splicing factor 3A subunit 1 [Camelina sativa]
MMKTITEPAYLSSMMLHYPEIHPLGFNQPTTTTTTQAQPVELRRPRSREYEFFENHITLNELGIIKLTAQFVARYGPRFRRDLMKKVVMNPLFEFLKQTDDDRNNKSRFFNLIEYRYSRVLLPSDQLLRTEDGCTSGVLEFFSKCLQLEKLEDGVEMATVDLHAFVGGLDFFTHMYGASFDYILPQPERLSKFMGSQLCNPQNLQDCCVDDDALEPFLFRPSFRFPAKGITLKELGTIMLTAQFVARYGLYFKRGLRKEVVLNPEFEFMEPTSGSRFCFCSQLVEFYSRVLLPWKRFDADTVLESFFDWVDRFQQEGLDLAMGCLNDFVSSLDCFAAIDGVPIPPPHVSFKLAIPGRACEQSLSPLMQPPPAVSLPEEPEPKTAPPPAVPLPEEAEPKRRKFDDESALAQRAVITRFQGSSTTISVFVPDVGEVVFRKK